MLHTTSISPASPGFGKAVRRSILECLALAFNPVELAGGDSHAAERLLGRAGLYPIDRGAWPTRVSACHRIVQRRGRIERTL